jgi:hypothetical protein
MDLTEWIAGFSLVRSFLHIGSRANELYGGAAVRSREFTRSLL